MIVSRVYVVQLAAKDSSTRRITMHLSSRGVLGWEVAFLMVGAFETCINEGRVVISSATTTCIIPKFQSFLSIFALRIGALATKMWSVVYCVFEIAG